jgi:hypothetical protein
MNNQTDAVSDSARTNVTGVLAARREGLGLLP